jgi:hypothetical protein
MLQLASIGTGREKVTLKVVAVLTVDVVVADVDPLAIVAGVETVRERLEESINPPFEAAVVIVIPVLGSVDIGFLTLFTENLTIELAAIVLDGFIEESVRISFEKSHVKPESMF